MLDPAASPPGRRDDDDRPTFHLPAPCFTSTELWDPERIGAVVLYCSDGRWGEAFDEFCHNRLLIPRYDRWAVPGGPVCLLPRDFGGESCKVVWDQLRFLVCAYYAAQLGKGPGDCLRVQAEDLHAAAAALRRGFPGIGVDTYFAMRHGVILSFHEVNAH